MFVELPPPTKRVSKNDFLICRGNGNRDLVGVGVYPREDRPDLVFPDTVMAASLDQKKINPFFLEAAWRQPAVRAQIDATARTTNGTYKVNQQGIGAIEIPLPSLSDQNLFAERLKAAPRPSISKVDELFRSIQSHVFSTKL